MKLDILGIVAHPDDVELSSSGTIIKHIKLGKKAGIVDLTQGELGTRGSIEIRAIEAANASNILGLSARENLRMPDGFFTHSQDNLLKVVEIIRKYQPEIVLTNAVDDRHPDHGKGAKLVAEACFLSGLIKVETTINGVSQKAWRPKMVLHGIQDYFMKPDIVVDVTAEWSQKMEAIKAFKSQFYSEDSKEPISPIATKDFFEFLEGRAKQFGRPIGVDFAEGFTSHRYLGVNNLFDLI